MGHPERPAEYTCIQGRFPMSQHSNYVLATGEAARQRLHLLNEIFGPASRELLVKAGLRSGQRVAEFGSGTGLMALWMADQIGNTGSVTAVDGSAEQLELAERAATGAGLKNISFRAADASETGLADGMFDLVYSRFLFCHLTRPAAALAEMRRLLKAGGVLVAEDFEMSSVKTYPATDVYRRVVEISRSADKRLGVNSDIGTTLHTIFQEGGFPSPEIAVHQIACLRGEVKQFWEITLREAAPAILTHGASTAEEMRSILREVNRIGQDTTTLVMVARVFQVWASRP